MISQKKSKDLKFLSLAINLAKNNIGVTAPNPSVATVIVKNNIILSTAITGFGGRPHAEELAISKISIDSLKNSLVP